MPTVYPMKLPIAVTISSHSVKSRDNSPNLQWQQDDFFHGASKSSASSRHLRDLRSESLKRVFDPDCSFCYAFFMARPPCDDEAGGISFGQELWQKTFLI